MHSHTDADSLHLLLRLLLSFQLYYNKVKPFTYDNQSINKGTQVVVDVMNNSCFLSL